MDKNVKIKVGTWSGRKGEEGGRHKVRLRSLIKPLKTNMKEVAQEPESTEKPKKKQIYTKEVKSALFELLGRKNIEGTCSEPHLVAWQSEHS